jgi:DNA transformation protein
VSSRTEGRETDSWEKQPGFHSEITEGTERETPSSLLSLRVLRELRVKSWNGFLPSIAHHCMSVSTQYLEYVLEQFASFTPVTSRRMFGGVGLYAEGLFFALIGDDTLYFKVDDSNRADYLARRSQPFRPFADDPTYSMNYFQLPEDVLEDTSELREWTRKSLAVAASASAAKRHREGVVKKRGPARRTKPRPASKR